jgi:PmbA protein
MGISPATGDFSSGARGLWIESGEVVHPVKGVTVASNVLEMLRGVNAVGDDLSFKQQTVCPTLRIGEMSIGGA